MFFGLCGKDKLSTALTLFGSDVIIWQTSNFNKNSNVGF